MIKPVSPFHYDIICDRCGASMTGYISKKAPGIISINVGTLERIKAKLWSEHAVGGWRLNPRNQTVVCQNCALIINKKGSKE